MNRVLFLCSGNYYRSRFAEELFNHKAQSLGLDWRATSRGLSLNPRNPGPISRLVIQRLGEMGINPMNADRLPTPVELADFQQANIAIALSQQEHYPLAKRLFPDLLERIEFWEVEDTALMTSEVALPRIEGLVEELIGRLR